jgi:L-idonate 5-dehydrogenase
MQACVVHGAGDLRVEDWPDDGPAAGEVEVKVRLGGICGSDLHYYHRGGVGDFTVVEPMVLGHEVVGVVERLGPGVPEPRPGTRVAVHPATPCGRCPECLDGRPNVCRDTRYLGSAARRPHVQGGFRERICVPADQVRTLPDGLSWERAVLAEPLSVAVHAVHRAGDVAGRRVLVTGAGPIGGLVVAVLRHAGAAEVFVSDLLPQALAVATALGATGTVLAGGEGTAGGAVPADVDVAVEASGSPAGLASCLAACRRGGTVVLLGLLPPGEVPFPGNLVVTRELTLTGAFRFGAEFDEAIRLLADGLPVDPVLTGTYPLRQARAAFDLASDRRRSSKVLLDMSAT